MYTEDALFNYVLVDLAEELAAHVVPAMRPMPCDRWIARSALQKACRRGEVEIAQRAVATLLTEDRYGIWRHLIVIAIEDIGVPGMEVIARVVAASRARSWRTRMGGEWAVASLLVQQMCESIHCQAACDLLLRAAYDPNLNTRREAVLELEIGSLALAIRAADAPVTERGLAALAIGGGLREGQQHRQPDAVFEALQDVCSSSVVATCRSAWRISQNEMAMLLPVIWQEWAAGGEYEISDDPLTASQQVRSIPTYALDQFTRAGRSILKELLSADGTLRRLLDEMEIPARAQSGVLGDILFLIEGSPVTRRAVWQTGEWLRKPHRCLPTVPRLGNNVNELLSYLMVKGREIASLRSVHLNRIC